MNTIARSSARRLSTRRAPASSRRLPFDQRVALHTAPPSPPGRWLVFCDRRGVGQAITEALRARGEEVYRVVAYDPEKPLNRQGRGEVVMRPESVSEMAQLIEATDVPGRPLRGIVHLWTMDAHAAPGTEPLQTLARQTGLLAVSEATAAAGVRPRLWVVTRGALAGALRNTLPGQQAIWSFGRVLSVAHPELRPTLVELDPDRTIGAGASALMRALTAAPAHRQLATRQASWFAPTGASWLEAA